MSNKVAVVTDTSTGLTPEKAKELGIYLVPMTVLVEGKEYQDCVTITTEEFIEKLVAGAKIGTSLPSPGYIDELFTELLKEYDEVIYMPLTSGMSGTYNSGVMIAKEHHGKVTVIDTKEITYSLLYNVLRAQHLVKQGLPTLEIKEILEASHKEETILLCTETLEYLRKGGRITPSIAAIGGLLKIKPVLIFENGNIESLAKVRTMTKAVQVMVSGILDKVNLSKPEDYVLFVSHFKYFEYAQMAIDLIKKTCEKLEVIDCPISSLILTHTGPDAMAVGVVKRFK